MRAWLAAFAFTQLIEVPIYMRGLGCGALAAFGASAITHPIVWFGFFSPRLSAPYAARAVAAELFAWLIEAAYFKLVWRKRRVLLWSLVANGASVGFALVCRWLFGAP